MPSNDVLVNGSIEYMVGDSKMDELMEWLDTNGKKQKQTIEEAISKSSDNIT